MQKIIKITKEEAIDAYRNHKAVDTDTLILIEENNVHKCSQEEYITPQEEAKFYDRVFNRKSDCLHDNCQNCEGTGVRKDGLGSCVHALYCPCKKHSVTC